MTTQTPGTGPGRAPACAECGTRAEPGQSFCDACGAVLDWAGDPAPAGVAARTRRPAAADEAAPTAGDQGSRAAGSAGPADGEPGWDAFARPGAGTGTARTAHDTAGSIAEADTVGADRAASVRPARDPHEDDAVGSGPDASAPGTPVSGTPVSSTPVSSEAADPSPMSDDTARPHPAPVASHGSVPAAPARADETAATEPLPSAAPDRDAAAERARSLLVPVADPEPRIAPSVAPVLPGRPVANRPQVRTPVAEPGADGGVLCPWCATPNRPDRHFCGRCALSMAGERQTPGRLPWWRRVLNSRNGEVPWAGDRPRLRRGFGRVMNWVVGAVVLGLLVFAAMNTGTAVQAVKDHFAKRVPVGPDHVKASRSFPGHGAGLAFDKLNNTWWGPGVAQSGDGEWLEARFEQPTRLLDVIITSGTSNHADQLTKSALPHRIEARITTANGKTTTRFLTLDQVAGGQQRKFRVGDVTAVRFIIRSAYGAAGDKQVSIAEIELFGPSSANDS
ncbi:zinc ribbon domain-containing protein [Streptomyces sp. NBC_01549]|uniref:NADase-type glycan-binding domain-containing protein n=1 Tax=Streptomyces sp. NBC_01549 TaxID=2975874 RepID=UPI00225391E0|nr:zinc ribbon domain-containing protein [Streptomyces sp. NBC_01549]MCX4595126.1 zinc ribbon domain-containing protein [Streptomyces sp. NBC_01549]